MRTEGRLRHRIAATILVVVVAGGCGGKDKTTTPPGDGTGTPGWSALGAGGVDGTVYALLPSSDALIIGGEFTSAGGTAAQNVARWDGHVWSALGSGLSGKVSALAVYQDTLLAAADTEVGGAVMAWDGATTWRPMGSPYLDGHVNALTVHAGSLFFGGSIPYNNSVVRWSAQRRAWEATAGTLYHVRVLLDDTHQGLLEGGFGYGGSDPSSPVNQWNQSSWSPLCSGAPGWVYALAVNDGDIFAGGDFTWTGDAHNLARFNGGAWHPLAAGVNAPIHALVSYHGDLIAGGEFTMAGSDSANYIARWDGTNWHPLGSGLNFTVYALTVYDDALTVGGAFTTAGGKLAHGIAVWKD